MNIRDAPWQVRRELREKENSRDRLMNWFCRLMILAELDIIVMLVGCLIHAAIT